MFFKKISTLSIEDTTIGTIEEAGIKIKVPVLALKAITYKKIFSRFFTEKLLPIGIAFEYNKTFKTIHLHIYLEKKRSLVIFFDPNQHSTLIAGIFKAKKLTIVHKDLGISKSRTLYFNDVIDEYYELWSNQALQDIAQLSIKKNKCSPTILPEVTTKLKEHYEEKWAQIATN